MNSDEIQKELAKRLISVMRKVVATDIGALNKYGYEVLSYCLPEIAVLDLHYHRSAKSILFEPQ